MRATSLLQTNGTLGLVATNSVAQGESREVGLDRMVADGFTITRAIQSQTWPSASANLEFAAVWGTRGFVEEDVPRVANGSPVRRISTLLEAAGRVEGLPYQLSENKGIAFEGCKLRGTGFIVEPSMAMKWIESAATNRDVLFPYLNGEDLNSRPDASASRWVIDFTGQDRATASGYQLPFMHVSQTVRSERSRLSSQLRDNYWLYERSRLAMRAAIADFPEVLVIACTSKSVMPVRVPTGQVFSNALDVFATADYSDQAVLSSSLHQLWAITYGSGMRNDPLYTPSDVFETFPRPIASASVAEAGRSLDRFRRDAMLRRNLGLTKLYNLVNDPAIADSDDTDIAGMRQAHVDLDAAVLDAYGWNDLDPQHGFHEYRKMLRWTLGPVARVEILYRLLEENHRRKREERTGEVPERRGTLEPVPSLSSTSSRR